MPVSAGTLSGSVPEYCVITSFGMNQHDALKPVAMYLASGAVSAWIQ